MAGKLIVIEGTDSSGKQTQADLLKLRLKADGYKVYVKPYPDYSSPTGRIIGGPLLGNSEICNSYFEDGPVNVDPKVAGMMYAMDRIKDKKLIDELIKDDYIVILDRYVTSNMAHQGSKIEDSFDRMNYYNWCINMEYVNNQLRKPDLTILLHMPTAIAWELKKSRTVTDEVEKNINHLLASEKTYLEVSNIFKWKVIECACEKDDKLSVKDINDINSELYTFVSDHLNLSKGRVIK